MIYDVCVVGNGLVGAALGCELAARSARVCIVGSAYGERDRYYSSHEDDSRIARLWHADPYWGELARRNVQQLASLREAAHVFRRVPVLYRFAPGRQPAGDDAIQVKRARLPFAQGFRYRDAHGGIINPKSYIRALNRAAIERGALVRRGIVEHIEWQDRIARIGTSAGDVFARRVADARGVLCGDAHPTVREAAIVAKVLVYIHAAPTPADSVYCFVDHDCDGEPFSNVYGIVNYTCRAGAMVSKFGFSERAPVILRTPEEAATWFRSGYRTYPWLDAAKRWITARQGGRWTIAAVRPCAFVATPDGRPRIGVDGVCLTVIGCNGMAAKCCQALAERAVNTWLESERAVPPEATC